VKQALPIADAVDTDSVDQDVMAADKSLDRLGAVGRHQVAAAAHAPGRIVVSKHGTVGTDKRHKPSWEYAANISDVIKAVYRKGDD